MKKFIPLCFFLAAVAFHGHAQLKYLLDGKLTLGSINPIAGCVTALEGPGHYLHYDNDYGTETWLKVILSATNARISGNGGYVVFYGDDFQDIYVRNVYTESDARAKTNIAALRNPLQTVLQLRPRTYSWAGTPNADKASGNREIGFLAQDLERTVPEAVATDAEGNRLVNYMALIPLLTGSIQELNARIAALEEEIRILKSE